MQNKYLTDAFTRMTKACKCLNDQFTGVRSYVSAGLVDTVKVDYNGSQCPLSQVAQVTVVNNNILVRPYDQFLVKEVERAIQKANLGLGIYSDKRDVHLSVPTMTGDQKEKMVYHLKKLSEDAKIAIRNIRKDVKKSIDKDKTLSEDQVKKFEKDLQVLTDDNIAVIQEATDKKVEFVME